jgi:hypothetical protein
MRMKRISSPVAAFAIAAFVSGCGSGDDTTSPVVDSGKPDSTVEGGPSPEAGPDSTLQDAPSEASSGEGGSASDGALADGAEAGPMEGGGACTPFDAGSLDDAAVAAGLQFILSKGHCNRCHQTDPDAGITLSGNMNSLSDSGPVFPPNLTPDPATGLGCWNNDQIASAILFGIDPAVDGGRLCPPMPLFGVGREGGPPALDDASVVNVVEFLRSLAATSYQAQATMCSRASSGPPDGGSPDAGDAASE